MDKLFFGDVEAQAREANAKRMKARGASDGWEPMKQVEKVPAVPGVYLGKSNTNGGK